MPLTAQEKEAKKRLKERYMALSVPEALEQLAEITEIRSALRARLIEFLRYDENRREEARGAIEVGGFPSDIARLSRKINMYPGEIGDARLLKITKKYYDTSQALLENRRTD